MRKTHRTLGVAVALALSASLVSVPLVFAADQAQQAQQATTQTPPAPPTDENGNPLPPPSANGQTNANGQQGNTNGQPPEPPKDANGNPLPPPNFSGQQNGDTAQSADGTTEGSSSAKQRRPMGPPPSSANGQNQQGAQNGQPPEPPKDENGNPLPPPDGANGNFQPPTDANGNPLPPPDFGQSQKSGNQAGSGQSFPAFGPGAMMQTKSASEFAAQKIVDAATEKLADVTLAATATDENALLVRNGGTLSLTKGTLSKTGDSSSADASNFSGQNAVFLAADSTAKLSNVLLTSDADGANAVFATGENAKVTAEHLRIRTKNNSSRGLDATYGGTIEATDVDITTEGAHCAALATDRGEGTVTVHNGVFKTSGEGSPNVYSTGNISVYDSQGQATGSEIAVVEGKNSITFDNVHLSGNKDHGIMLYQSFSGDAGVGEASFSAKNSGLTNLSDGPMFFVTNTKATATLENNELETKGDTLVSVAAARWGNSGSNGGDFTLKAKNQHLSGKVTADAISKVTLELGDGAAYVGAFNSDNTAQAANLTLAKKASLMLTADAYVTAFSDAQADFKNIKSRGHNIYYDASASTALGGKTYDLPGGGKLLPKA